MATIGREENGHKRILFVGGDGARKTVRLGKCPCPPASQPALVGLSSLYAQLP